MLGVCSALIEPVGKVLLKATLGDAAADIGTGMLKYAREVLKDSVKAADAASQARRIAEALARDVEVAMSNDGVDPAMLEAATAELAETLRLNVNTAFLIGSRLRSAEIRQRLIDARPPNTFYRVEEPEYSVYVNLVDSLAPRLRLLASKLPDYTLERDAALLSQMANIAEQAASILASVSTVHDEVAAVSAKVEGATERIEREERQYRSAYLKAVQEALDYVEVLGLELDRTRREARLSIAYLSLTTSSAGIGRQSYEDLIRLLPALGGRLLIEGVAGSGKSTLLRWTAVWAATAGQVERAFRSSNALFYPNSQTNVAAVGYDPILANLMAIDKNAKIQAKPALGMTLSPLISSLASLDHPAASTAAPAYATYWATFLEVSGRLSSADLNRLGRQNVLGRLVPFHIRLRHLSDGLPPPDELPSHLSRSVGNPPAGWVRALLQNGEAMLLIDGIDEVPEGEQRDAALNSLRDYVTLYDECIFIVATRPGASDKAMMQQLKFVEAQLDELSPDQRNVFIDHWHRAYASNAGLEVGDADILLCADELKATIHLQPQIARLATNPLLCAGICALHERSRTTLPKNEWDLCTRLTEMLVEQRDRSSGRQGRAIRVSDFGPAYQLSYPVKRSILARLAEAMVSQQLSALPYSEALAHAQAVLDGSKEGDGISLEAAINALTSRSGVLRTASMVATTQTELTQFTEGVTGSDQVRRDAVEFVHNTLKAWLASLHLLAANKPRELAAQALTSSMDEVIVFAAAAPTHMEYASILISELLGSADRTADPQEQRSLRILALRCDAVAPVLPVALRGVLNSLPDILFPPRNFDEAQQLAALGDAAVHHLRWRSDLAEGVVAPSTRCLRLIASPAALQTLEAYYGTTDSAALEELAQIVNPLLLTAVRNAVSNALFWIEIRASVKARIEDVSPLAGALETRELYLSGTAIEQLDAISGLSGLETLDITNTRVRDIALVGNFRQLVRLEIAGAPITDLEPLDSLPYLHSLTISSEQLTHLMAVRDRVKLKNLTLNGNGFSSLEPLNDWAIESLTLAGTDLDNLSSLPALPSLNSIAVIIQPIQSLAPLVTVPALRELALVGVTLSDWEGLGNLVSLEKLSLFATELKDATPLGNLASLRSLEISSSEIRDIMPLGRLTNLEHLELLDTPVSDIGPIVDLPNLRLIVLREDQVPLEQIEKARGALAGREVRLLTAPLASRDSKEQTD